MALILNIDTATDQASVAICNNGGLLGITSNSNQKEHASFVHTAIKELLTKNGLGLKEVQAVAVTSGPGSYTGLRVGMATAKGLCYSLNIPLICINTLLVMACAAKQHLNNMSEPIEQDSLLCPMIDARRMEVFMALYNLNLNEIEPPMPKILSEDFLQYVKESTIYVFGSGSKKILNLQQNNIRSMNVFNSAAHLGLISDSLFKQNSFSDVAYSEPQYYKEFYSTVHR